MFPENLVKIRHRAEIHDVGKKRCFGNWHKNVNVYFLFFKFVKYNSKDSKYHKKQKNTTNKIF